MCAVLACARAPQPFRFAQIAAVCSRRARAAMPYVIGSPEFARFRTLAAAVSTEPPQFLQHLAAQLLKFMLTCMCTSYVY